MPNNTLHNGFHLLEIMARNPRPWSIAELAEQLAWPRSHVHRLLTSLTEMGYLQRPEKSRLYQVDVKLFELASALATEHPLRRLSGPALRRLADQTRGSAYLIVWHNEAPLVLAVDHFGGKRVGNVLEVGKRLDPHTTASGRLFMALLGEPAGASPLPAAAAGELQAEIAQVRARRVSIVRSAGGGTIAAYALPVYDREDRLAAAIGLVVPADRGQPQHDLQWVAACAAAARNVSAALGYTGLYPIDPDAPELALQALPTATHPAPLS